MCEAHGLACRGGFHPGPTEDFPAAAGGTRTATLVLLGFTQPHHFEAFARSPEWDDGEPHPLDRWSRRVIDGLAGQYAARALYPFAGPPWLPFQRWAQRAEPVHVSPINLLIHPVHGLWHAYRGALAFAAHLEVPPRQVMASPCEDCREKPCLTGCPVGALGPKFLDRARCSGHLESPAGAQCFEVGCRARARCPVAADKRYAPIQARFHLSAFFRSARADAAAP
jgi:hypothetical protein